MIPSLVPNCIRYFFWPGRVRYRLTVINFQERLGTNGYGLGLKGERSAVFHCCLVLFTLTMILFDKRLY